MGAYSPGGPFGMFSRNMRQAPRPQRADDQRSFSLWREINKPLFVCTSLAKLTLQLWTVIGLALSIGYCIGIIIAAGH